MLNKKIKNNSRLKVMLLVGGALMSSSYLIQTNTIETYAVTTVSNTGITTVTNIANMSTTSSKYSDYFTVPEDVTDAKFIFDVACKSTKYGDVISVYICDYTPDEGYIIPNRLVYSKENSNYGHTWNFYNLETKLKAGHKYRIELKYDGGSGGSATLSDTKITYSQTPENLMDIINKKLDNVNSQSDIDEIQGLINKTQTLIDVITDDVRKSTLQDNLNLSKERLLQIIYNNNIKVQETTNAVIIAENTLLQSDIDSAQSLINGLLVTTERNDLQNRLDIVSATIAVQKAETTYSQEDYTSATNLVDKLSSSTTKTSLNNRLSEVLKIYNSITYVNNAEKLKTQSALKKAKTSVSGIKDSDIKTSLNNRLDILERIITIENDKLKPNNPIIDFSDNKIKIDAIDVEHNEALNIDIIDTFETDVFQNEITGAWARTNLQSCNGSYSLGSTNQKLHSTTNSSTVTFEVLEKTTGKLSFNYLVKSESAFDTLRITLNGTEIIRLSGDNSWLSYSSGTLSPGVYTLTMTYSKDSSVSKYDDTAYIDNLKIEGTGTITHQPSGVKTIEYQINDGEWIEYNEAFTPKVNGEVTINTRAIDYAGNISDISTKTIYVENSQIDEAIENIEELEMLILDLETNEKLENTINLYDETISLMSQMPESADKEVLANKLLKINNAIQQAQLIFNAKNSVTDLEELNKDLSNQSLIDNAKVNLDETLALVNSISDEQVKNNLLNRIEIVKTNIDVAQATINVITAENSMVQNDVDVALSLVQSLPDNQFKTDLLNRIEEVQYKINLQIALKNVDLAETTIKQSDVDNAMNLVNMLRENDKTVLINRLSVIQNIIDSITLVEQIEFNLTDLSVQSKIDSVNKDIIKVNAMINNIVNEKVKNDLISRIESINTKIDEAQAEIYVSNLEDSLAVEDIEIAKNSIAKVKNEELRIALTKRVNDVENLINEENNVNELYNEFKDIISDINSMDLKELNNKKSLNNLLETLNKRVQVVLDKLNNNNANELYNIFKDIISNINSNINPNKSLNDLLDVLNKEAQVILDRLNSLPNGNTSAMENKKQMEISKLKEIQGTISIVKQVITLNDNPYHANGNAEFREKINKKTTINLATNYNKELMLAFGTTEGLNYISADSNKITVSEDGTITTLKSGLGKVVVYNENTYYEMYFIVSIL